MAKEEKDTFEEKDAQKENETNPKTTKVKREKTPPKEKKPKTERKPIPADAPVHQVMPIVMTALAAFFGVCLFTRVEMGLLGKATSGVCFGLFGFAAYLIPILFLLSALLWHMNAKRDTLVRSQVFYLVIIFLVSVLCYTFGMPTEHQGAIARFYSLGATHRIGGGILGGLTGFALNFLVSQVGTVIFVIALLTVFLVLGLGIRPKELLRRAGVYLAARAQRAREKRRAAEEARMAEEMERRNQKIHTESNFYEQTSLSVPKPTPRVHTNGDTDAVFYPSSSHPIPQKGLSRRFFDAEAEEKEVPASTPVEVPLASEEKHPPSRFFFDAEQQNEPASAQSGTLPPDPHPVDVDSLEIQIVSSNPIPANNTVPFGRPKTTVEVVEQTREEPVPVPATPATPAAEEVAEEAPAAEEDTAAVINKAHVVEHIGADTLGDDDAKKYTSDTFFYSFPPLSLLREDDNFNKEDSDQEIHAKENKLKETFKAFGVAARIDTITRGPRLTRYEVVPEAGVRISKIENLVDEITMNLEAISVRIEAPIPGKAAIGVEVPNINTTTVRLRGLLDTDTFRDAPGKTTVCLGVDVVGVPVYADLDKMPHLLVAGATGMGKSVCINSILVSLLYKARPDEVKLILIDPKKVEFQSYANIPHLLVPVVTEPQKAAGALAWAVSEMERRYDLIESAGVRNIASYNKTVSDHPGRTRIPQIVIVIDELHDLMIQARDAVEDSIARIAAKARAAGVLLIIGTQRPSVNVITGVIKANIPSRIAFHVASQVDSRTILDAVGAEKLLNNGDMLFLSPGMKMMTPKRIQGAFLDDDEVMRVTEYLRKNSSAVQYDEAIMYDMERESERYNKDKKQGSDSSDDDETFEGGEEDMFYRAVEIALESGKIATSLLQRRLKVGYGKAARMIDRMFDMGIVGPPNGQKPRDVLITPDEYHAMRLRNDE